MNEPDLPNPQPAMPRPFQFGLRALLAATAILCGMFAVMGLVGSLWSVIIGWFALLVAAHVSANAWGSKVGRRRLGGDEAIQQVVSPPADLGFPNVPPSARLRERSRPGRTMCIVTSLAALTGGTLGSILLAAAVLGRAGLAGIIVGGLSAAIVGGFLGFLVSSFAEVAGGALHEAAQRR